MDIATIIGLVMACGVIVATMGKPVLFYWQSHAAVIVIGGLIASTFVKFSLKEVLGAGSVIGKVFKANHETPQELIEQLTEMSNIARKDGILALEKVKTPNQFLQTAINHCVDGMDPETLQSILYKDTAYLAERHHTGVVMFDSMGEAAPAMGMVGTLVGMVEMLADMSDPSSIGPAMAKALLATCYGAIVANMVAIPMGIKLHHYSAHEQMMRQIVIDGVTGIQKGLNPRVLETLLMAALSGKEREKV
ncbi:MAG: MotA/TolQ/ExbB proton channel family protein [Magnetococcales bacterium]|nr:MotA/TolQ/ExbB proton channel family protein [Magnetococcales bacterium]